MAQTTETKRATPIVLWGSLAVIAIVAVVALRSIMREKVAVHVTHASYQDLIKASSTNGKVEPVQDFQAHAAAPGVVAALYVNVGDHVQANQLLLKMDDADARASLARAQSTLRSAELGQSDIQQGGTQDERNGILSDLAKARLQVQQDETVLAARQQLQGKGAASPAEVSDARQHLEIDRQTLASLQQHSTQRYGENDRARAESQMAEARASLAAAENSYAGANIRAPFAGTVYSLPVAQYDYVPAGDDLIYVANLNRIQVLAYFDEPEVGNLAVGQPVKIVWDAKPGQIWHGHISIAPTSIITYNTRNVGEAYITVDDARGDLQPNANVTVTVTTAQHRHVLSVPREALHTDGSQTYVFRVVDGTLVRTPVQVGVVNLTRVEVVSGIKDSDVIALSATTNRDLTDGLPVKPIE